jgi:ribose transport system substrate-binding protein
MRRSAIENAETFIRERVDVVIEFQVDEHVAPIIADKIAEAGIPLIAVDIPHPRATFIGVDNYRAGLEAGGLLADHALNYWDGKMDWMIGLDIEEAGQLVQSRITGAFQCVKTRLPNLPVESFVRIDGRGLREKSHKVMLDFLNRHPKDKHILVAAANDTSAMGAIAAVRELGREKHVVVVGQDCVEEMLQEMQRPNSPAIGSISHEVQVYGAKLIDLGSGAAAWRDGAAVQLCGAPGGDAGSRWPHVAGHRRAAPRLHVERQLGNVAACPAPEAKSFSLTRP